MKPILAVVGRNISPWGTGLIVALCIFVGMIIFARLSFKKLSDDFLAMRLLKKCTQESVYLHRRIRGIMCIIGAAAAGVYAVLTFLGDMKTIDFAYTMTSGAYVPGALAAVIIWIVLYLILRFAVLKKKPKE